MEIRYSKHLQQRLLLRKIDYDLPKWIFNQASERSRDEETGYFIATMKVELYNRTRDVMIAYVIKERFINLLTIHPLKEGQKENRVNSGRWREI